MSKETDQARSGPGPSHATVFIWLFAVAAIWHYTSSSGEIVNVLSGFHPVVTPLVLLAVATAFVAALFPNKTPALLVFSCGQLVAMSIRFPYVADHFVMELLLHVSIVSSFAFLAIKRRTLAVDLSDIFELFAPIGRWLLIVMYFFGTFHKINAGFLSPESSCAIPFIHGFPLPDAMLDHGAVQGIAIYGTLILEALAMVLLLSTRTKYFGMLLGMTFHFIIGISGYGTLAHFSAFALALHTLFVPSGFGQRVFADAVVPPALKTATSFRALTIMLVALQVAFAVILFRTTSGFLVNALFAVFAICLMYLVWKHGQIRQGDAPYRLRSRLLPANVIPVLLVIYCVSPYVGLGTGGSLAMFSGLRTEGGISNHYVITEPLGLFSYQDKVLYAEDAINASLHLMAEDGQGIVMFDFQRHFANNEDLLLPLTVRVDGVRYALTDLDSFQAFVNEHFTEQSWLERKYMSFRLVDDPYPNTCRH